MRPRPGVDPHGVAPGYGSACEDPGGEGGCLPDPSDPPFVSLVGGEDRSAVGELPDGFRDQMEPIRTQSFRKDLPGRAS
jgi:hypothetical protein